MEPISNNKSEGEKIVGDKDKFISYEQWTEMMAREIFLLKDEKPKEISRLYEMSYEDYDEDEEMSSRPRKK